jgi:hypothetical protein
LYVDGETRVEFLAGLGEEAHGEFALEHEDAGAWGVGEGEQFEDEGRRDLVGCVGDADVEVGEFGLYSVSIGVCERCMLCSRAA